MQIKYIIFLNCEMARLFQVVMHQDTQSLLKSYLWLATLNTKPSKIKKIKKLKN